MLLHTFWRLTLELTVFTLFVSRVHAVPQDDTDNSLKPLFALQGGTDINGVHIPGCDPHEQNLKTSWEEACLASRQVISDLNFLEANRGPNDQGPDATQPQDRTRWNRIHNMFVVLFGPAFGPNTDLKRAAVRYFFNDVVNRCSTRQASPRFQQFRVFCEDKHWTYLKPDDPDPEQPDQKIGKTHPQCKKAIQDGGLWYSPLYPDGQRYDLKLDPPRKPGDGVCASRDVPLAFVQFLQQTITFCNFNGLVSLQSIRNNILAPHVDNPDTALNMIENGQLTTLVGISGQFNNALTTTWLHEMAHLLKFYDDGGRYTRNGKKIFEKRTFWDFVTGGFTRRRQQIATEFEDLVILGQIKPDEAMRCPESLAQFAVAMYLDDWDWSKGYAQPPA